MGKVKSAIITALLLAALITLALFATVSMPNVGNSFIAQIPLGREFTGDASVLVYPEGVITEAEYKRDTYAESGEADNKKKEEYEEKYEYLPSVGLYVEKDKLNDGDGEYDGGATLSASVVKDAEIISQRLSEKAYSGYSVTVVDGYAIRISVPTTFTYAEYMGEESGYNAARTKVDNTMRILSRAGGLSLRSEQTYSKTNNIYKELDNDNEFNSFFKGASVYKIGGNTALRVELTHYGVEQINKVLKDASGAYLFVGETFIGLSFNAGEELPGTRLEWNFTGNTSAAEDLAALIDSVANGKMLANEYNYSSGNLANTTPAYGKNSAIYLAFFVLAMILIAAALPTIKYKMLGLVNAIMVATYSLALITAMMLIGIELTIGGVFTALFGLALLSFSNFFTFEAVRREVGLGRTMGSAIKLGYKKSLFAVLDVHIVLLIASIFMTLVGVGELASCGLIFLIATIASYALYWFTRFMWYVISSFKRNKFAFCGFVRGVDDDE